MIKALDVIILRIGHCANVLRAAVYQAPLVFISSFSIAASAPDPRSICFFPFPSTWPSGCASTSFAAPGCLLPLSLAFFSFFFVSGGGYAFFSTACHSCEAWNSACMGSRSFIRASVTPDLSNCGVSYAKSAFRLNILCTKP